MKRKTIYTIIILLLVIFCLLYYFKGKKKDDNTLKDISISVNDIYDDINWSSYKEEVYTLSESINITDEGIYHLTGVIDDGLISINCNSNVKLILDNVSITNSKGPAIYVKNAKNVVIELSDNSNNYLIDGSSYVGFDEDEVGTIFSHDNLILQGNGFLEITSNNEDAIVTKDNLKIINGNYKITSKDDAIRGKDSVYIVNGVFDINASGDGIKSTNDSNSDKGFVLIEGGKFNIVSSLDGISSKNNLVIKDGEFNIITGNSSDNDSSKNTWGKWKNAKSSNEESAKGIKSQNNLVIENGVFDIDSSDDAIHSNNYIGISNGEFNISSGDDGIHADSILIIDNGNINISKSYEGIESSKITINNGNINIISSDDGINIAGGKDSSAKNRPGENNYSNKDNILTINDGNITVNASGDGIDINGSGYIYGGYIIIYGPSDNGNGALDYDNVLEVNGGVLIAGGASGMMQTASSSSSQYNVAIRFTSSYNSDDVIKIIDMDNNEIISYNSSKSYNSLVVSSSLFEKDKTYKIMVNELEYKSFTIKNIITNIGNNMSNNMNKRR